MKLLASPDLNPKSLLGTFTIFSFVMAVISIILGHIFLVCLPATILTIIFFALNLLFYRMVKIDEFQINLKTGAIEAKDEEKDNNDKGS